MRQKLDLLKEKIRITYGSRSVFRSRLDGDTVETAKAEDARIASENEIVELIKVIEPLPKTVEETKEFNKLKTFIMG